MKKGNNSKYTEVRVMVLVNCIISSLMICIHVKLYISDQINPFKPDGISHSNKLYQSISVLRVVGSYFSFLFEFKF